MKSRAIRQGNPRAGLTLIEILIAVSLLSLLSVGVLWSMRIGFNTMEKTDNRLIHNRRVANSRKIIENELNGFIGSFALFHPKPEENRIVPFFQAEPGTMRFVTNYSLEDAWRGRPQLSTLTVVAGDRNEGVRLVLNEMPYTGSEQAGRLVTAVETDPQTGWIKLRFPVADAGPSSFVLADKLAYCRFTYMQTLYVAPFQVWRPDWLNSSIYPVAVRIEMAPLRADDGDIHVTSVTLALPVTQTAGRIYDDR